MICVLAGNAHRMLFTVFDVAAVCVGRDRSADSRWRVVIDRTVRNEADVVLDQVPVLAILPRIEFNAEARVEAAESQRAAGLPEGIGSDVLKNEYHAVGPGRIERAKVHGEIQVKRLRQVDEIRIPHRTVLVPLRGGQLIAIATQRLSGAVQEVGLCGQFAPGHHRTRQNEPEQCGCKKRVPRHAAKLEVQSDFQIHPPVGQVIRNGIQPAVYVP